MNECPLLNEMYSLCHKALLCAGESHYNCQVGPISHFVSTSSESALVV